MAVHTLLVTIAATNTAQRMVTFAAGLPTHAAWISLQASGDNAATVYHGASNVSTSNGQAIAAGGGGANPQYPPTGVTNPYDLQDIWVVGTQNDTVRVLYHTT